MRKKHVDLETLAKNLDISPTMHKYAVERYEGISNYLESQGIKAEFYPQGSFRTGTVVRPLKNGIETDFDIDVVCELSNCKKDTSPKIVKLSVGDALKKDETYRKKLEPEEDRCWTLTYAKVTDEIGLKLDVVPCVKEDESIKQILKAHNVKSEYAEKAISITEKNESEYKWLASNPNGYGDWFDDINKRFLNDNLSQKKKTFFMENRTIFAESASAEDVPNYYIKSSLQRIIQLLKRHRDVYYSRIKDGELLRPASVIIVTLVAKIANPAPDTDIESLLSYVVSGLKEYACILQGRTPTPRFFGEQRNYIEKKDQKWKICNPVNPDDNYADSWTDETAKAFFRWVDAVSVDLSDPTPIDETRYLTGLKSGLGSEFIEKSLPDLKVPSVSKSQNTIHYPTKPWGNFR